MSKIIEELLHQANLNKSESSIACEQKIFSDAEQSAQAFSVIKTKILDVNNWNDYSAISGYKLFNEDGSEHQDQLISIGLFLRISLADSGKYDWVKFINIRETTDEFVITVKPAFDPTNEKEDRSAISHFFTDEATNNFALIKNSEKVALYVIGLAEKLNTGETENSLQTIRNVGVKVGSYLGFQEGEWGKFCKHFIEIGADKIEKHK